MAQAIVQDEMAAAKALAESLVMVLCEQNLDRIVDRHMPVTWRQGVRFANDPNPYTARLGYVILLTAVLETPGTADALLLAIINDLRGDPDA